MTKLTPQRTLRRLALVLVWALTAQYLLGSYVELFIEFPEGASGSAAWGFAWSNLIIATHMALAAVMLAGTVWLCVRAWRLGMRRAFWLSLLSFAALLGASACGARYVDARNDWWSYGMAVCFILAMTFLSYVLAVSRTSTPSGDKREGAEQLGVH